MDIPIFMRGFPNLHLSYLKFGYFEIGIKWVGGWGGIDKADSGRRSEEQYISGRGKDACSAQRIE